MLRGLIIFLQNHKIIIEDKVAKNLCKTINIPALYN